MHYLKRFLLLSFILVSGCTTTPETNSQDYYRSPSFIDRSIELGLFTDGIIGLDNAGGNFSDVGDHTTSYIFRCKEIEYTIVFKTVNNNHKTISTELKSLEKNSEKLKSSQIRKINKGISKAELVGPVGLRCSDGETNEKVKMSLSSGPWPIL